MKIRTVLMLSLAAVIAAACSKKSSGGPSGAGNTSVTGAVLIANPGAAPAPTAGATVELLGGPSTTTDPTGNWTLLLASNFTGVLRASATGALTQQFEGTVPPGGVSAVNFLLPSNTEVSDLAGLLSATLDPAKGLVAVTFNFAGAASAGYAASLGAATGGSFVLTSNETPVAGTATVNSNQSAVVFYNVAPGSTTATTTPPNGHTCTPEVTAVTSYPVDANILTTINFACD